MYTECGKACVAWDVCGKRSDSSQAGQLGELEHSDLPRIWASPGPATGANAL